MRTISAIILFSTILTNAQEKITILLPQQTTLTQAKQLIAEKKQQHLIELAFDIHDVILHPKAQKQLSTLVRSPQKYQLLKFITNPYLTAHAVKSLLTLIGGAFNSVLDKPAPAVKIETFLEPLKNHNDLQLHNLLIELANSLEVDRDVEAIIKHTAQSGIPIRVASNINETVFFQLKQKLKAEKITVFSWFSKDTHNCEGKVVKMRGICKPQHEYFEEYLAAYNPHNNKLFIFIDDRKENVQAAVQSGSFIGIIFNSAEQLKKDLHTLGVL
ncbi:hypothetical protein Noda2021_08920 [Candidatus Dependentiae bacterium Noda2021]|nr:hypothetical protein Noda2021_08920 [Candidatus Dependentiae bacterium Noda2021]